MNAPMKKIRILIADDSSLTRGILRALLAEQADLEIVGDAGNGKQAVQLAASLQPDLITMDLDMPVMNGLQAMEEIMHQKAVPILVVSDFTESLSETAALAHGALDTMGKPAFTPEDAAHLQAKIRMLASIPVVTRIRARQAPAVLAPQLPPAFTTTPISPLSPTSNFSGFALPGGTFYTRVFAIACSTGGPPTLARILPKLPADFPCPILIAQHIADGFAQGMVDWLGGLCKLPVQLATEGEKILGGRIYISPSEKNLAVTAERSLTLLAQGPSDTYHPSCDALLNSVAEVFTRQAIGIILTGMGSDGAKGMARIRECHGSTLGQDEASSVIYGMNRVAIEAGVVQQVLPPEAIVDEMIRLADPFAELLAASSPHSLHG